MSLAVAVPQLNCQSQNLWTGNFAFERKTFSKQALTVSVDEMRMLDCFSSE
jgi:hypothetical protein